MVLLRLRLPLPLLGASLLCLGLAGCGGGGTEPGAAAEARPEAAAGVERAWTVEDRTAMAERFGHLEESESGLCYRVERAGDGQGVPPAGARVTVHYDGTFLDGRVFDSSRVRERPFSFRVGLRQVVPGWDEALGSMERGERRILVVPWWLAYGEKGILGRIPPRTPLVFDVEMLDWEAEARAPGAAAVGP